MNNENGGKWKEGLWSVWRYLTYVCLEEQTEIRRAII